MDSSVSSYYVVTMAGVWLCVLCSLQAFRMPQKIFIKRLDTQLNMWILEAKNFPPKKK